MTVIDQWTGRHARALQAAMRLTNEAFAEHLGVSPRTIAKWRERPGMVPSPQLQEALDTSLTLATEDTRTRFASNLNLPPADDDPIILDTSLLSQLHAAIGELARVLATLQPPKAPAQADTATRLDEVQT
jgi:transcriptional regulator with XRE-family HTH domain